MTYGVDLWKFFLEKFKNRTSSSLQNSSKLPRRKLALQPHGILTNNFLSNLGFIAKFSRPKSIIMIGNIKHCRIRKNKVKIAKNYLNFGGCWQYHFRILEKLFWRVSYKKNTIYSQQSLYLLTGAGVLLLRTIMAHCVCVLTHQYVL